MHRHWFCTAIPLQRLCIITAHHDGDGESYVHVEESQRATRTRRSSYGLTLRTTALFSALPAQLLHLSPGTQPSSRLRNQLRCS